jgi:hypothetical protein
MPTTPSVHTHTHTHTQTHTHTHHMMMDHAPDADDPVCPTTTPSVCALIAGAPARDAVLTLSWTSSACLMASSRQADTAMQPSLSCTTLSTCLVARSPPASPRTFLRTFSSSSRRVSLRVSVLRAGREDLRESSSRSVSVLRAAADARTERVYKCRCKSGSPRRWRRGLCPRSAPLEGLRPSRRAPEALEGRRPRAERVPLCVCVWGGQDLGAGRVVRGGDAEGGPGPAVQDLAHVVHLRVRGGGRGTRRVRHT